MKGTSSRLMNCWTFVACALLNAATAYALPFNDDMVLNPMRTGSIMRPLPKGSVSVGSSEHYIADRDEALKLVNPSKGDPESATNGKRLFKTNCSPCHGDIAAVPYKPGKVAQFVPGPNLAMDLYHEKPSNPANGAGRSDGSIYGTMQFGSLSTLMPALGYKLSPSEHWDIINYIRKVQASSK